MIALSAIILIEFLVALLPSSNWLWGANLLRYYPTGVVAGWAMLALLLIWWPLRSGAARGPSPLSPLVGGLCAAIAALLLLHALRSQSHLLGDGYEIIRRLRQNHTPAPRSPLFNALSPGLFRLMGGVGDDGGGEAAGWFAVLLGAISAGVVAGVALRLLARGRAAGGAAMTLLFLTPLLQVFSGYVESYASFHAGAVIFFAFAFDRMLGGGGGALGGATAGLGMALASHPFAATLLPAWFFLLASPVGSAGANREAPGGMRRRLLVGAGALAALALAAALVFAIWPALRASDSPWRYAAPQELIALTWKLTHNVFGRRPWADRYTITSLVHFADVLNTAWLVGAPGLAVLTALALRPEGRQALRSHPARLALLALPLILLCRVFLRTPLGASRDWDVFAGLGLGLNAIAAGGVLGLGRGGLVRPLAAAGLFLALPFIGIQVSPDRAARRHFDAIDSEPRPEPFIASGYHGVMGDRFADLGQYSLAGRAYERSLGAFPRKEYAWRLGTIEMAQQHYERAVIAFERTLRIDPDHREARTELGNALNGLGRFARADSVLGEVIARFPAESGLAMVYRARARFQLGDISGGREWLEAADRTLPADDAGRKDLKRLRDEVADAVRAGAAPSPPAVVPADTPPTPR